MRCSWLNNDTLYIKYHDEEWGVPSFDDKYLFEMIVLESFHTGLSWYIILKKREKFRIAFDNFDINKIINYSDSKINELLCNEGIVRHRGKIEATINNAKAFLNIQKEYTSFSNYIWSFTNNKIIKETGITKSNLSDEISKDLKKKGFKFLGSTTVYAYLCAVGIINSHQEKCFKYQDCI